MEVLELYKADIPISEIANRMGCSETYIRTVLQREGCDVPEGTRRRRAAAARAKVERIIELYDTHGTLEISHITGITQSTVSDAVKDLPNRRSRAEERDMNKAYQQRRKAESHLMRCVTCGAECDNDESGLCKSCRDPVNNISEHDAWLEFEAGWGDRRGNLERRR